MQMKPYILVDLRVASLFYLADLFILEKQCASSLCQSWHV